MAARSVLSVDEPQRLLGLVDQQVVCGVDEEGGRVRSGEGWRAVSRRWRAAVSGLVVATVAVGCVPLVPSESAPYQPLTSTGEWSELVLSRPDGSRAVAADPFVLQEGGRWYLYPTSAPGAGFEAWSSTDLRSWDYAGFVWRPSPGSWNDRGGYWAPFVEQDDDGSYLMYYTASQRIGVARASSPLGPFHDLIDHPLLGGGHGGVGDGQRVELGLPMLDHLLNLDDLAIDAHVLRADGSRTLYFSYAPSSGPTTIGAIPLVDDAELGADRPTEVLSIELASWEGVVREAPVVERTQDGNYALTYSGSPYNNTCYAVGLALSASPLGPFRRAGDGPFLSDDPAIGLYGPGHHAFTTAADGSKVIVFHTQTTLDRDQGRQIRWARVEEQPDGSLSLVDEPGQVGSGRSSCWPFPLRP